jgi:hypothetical protein
MTVARFMVRVATALLLHSPPVLAQIIPTGTPAADILLSRALSEQRIFLTCSSLDGYAHPLTLQGWAREVAAATKTLTENNVPPEAIAAFTKAAQVANLMPAPDTPFSEVKELCEAYPDWQADYARLSFTILEIKLPQAFE